KKSRRSSVRRLHSCPGTTRRNHQKASTTSPTPSGSASDRGARGGTPAAASTDPDAWGNAAGSHSHRGFGRRAHGDPPAAVDPAGGTDRQRRREGDVGA